LYFARTTKKYHVYDEPTLSDYMDKTIVYDADRLREAYFDALDYNQSWSHFLAGDEKIIDVDYQDLMKNMSSVMSRVVEFIGCGGDVDLSIERTHGNQKRIYRMTRPEAKEYEDKLRSLVSVKFL
jgi:LPS sulfotransferase NodH